MRPRVNRFFIPLIATTLGLLLPLQSDSSAVTIFGSPDIAGYTTRCAGYVAIAQYEAGLTFCNRALEMYELDWRIKVNRAAARFGFTQTAVA